MPGHWELIALGIVILLLFGSKQLPSIARNLGRGVREVRETVVDVDPRKEIRQLDPARPDAVQPKAVPPKAVPPKAGPPKAGQPEAAAVDDERPAKPS